MSQSTLTTAHRSLDERVSYTYTVTLKDGDDTAISDGDLLTLTLTLYDVRTGDILNSRNAQNVLNASNVTVASGVVTWKMQPADNVIIATGLLVDEEEEHRALFTWTWTDSDTDTQTGRHEVALFVRNLEKVSS